MFYHQKDLWYYREMAKLHFENGSVTFPWTKLPLTIHSCGNLTQTIIAGICWNSRHQPMFWECQNTHRNDRWNSRRNRRWQWNLILWVLIIITNRWWIIIITSFNLRISYILLYILKVWRNLTLFIKYIYKFCVLLFSLLIDFEKEPYVI